MINNCKRYLIKGSITISKTISIHTVESSISKNLAVIQKKYSKYVEIGSYPFFRLGIIGVSVVLRSQNKKKISQCYSEIKKMVKNKKIKIYKN